MAEFDAATSPFNSPLEEQEYLAEFDRQHRWATMHFLSELTQTTTVAVFQAAFEELIDGVPGLSEPILILTFLSGLQEDIQQEFHRLAMHSTLQEAFDLACTCEARATQQSLPSVTHVLPLTPSVHGNNLSSQHSIPPPTSLTTILIPAPSPTTPPPIPSVAAPSPVSSKSSPVAPPPPQPAELPIIFPDPQPPIPPHPSPTLDPQSTYHSPSPILLPEPPIHSVDFSPLPNPLPNPLLLSSSSLNSTLQPFNPPNPPPSVHPAPWPHHPKQTAPAPKPPDPLFTQIYRPSNQPSPDPPPDKLDQGLADPRTLGESASMLNSGNTEETEMVVVSCRDGARSQLFKEFCGSIRAVIWRSVFDQRLGNQGSVEFCHVDFGMNDFPSLSHADLLNDLRMVSNNTIELSRGRMKPDLDSDSIVQKNNDQSGPDPDPNPKEMVKALTNAQEGRANRSSRTPPPLILNANSSTASTKKRGPANLFKRRYDTMDCYENVRRVVKCGCDVLVIGEAPHPRPIVVEEVKNRRRGVMMAKTKKDAANGFFDSIEMQGTETVVITNNIRQSGWMRMKKIGYARGVFDEMLHKRFAPFSTIILEFTSHGAYREYLLLILDMQRFSIHPYSFILVALFIRVATICVEDQDGSSVHNVVNHGVPDEVIEEIKIAWEEFYKFSLKGKETFAPLPRGLQGYGQKLVLNEGKLGWQSMLFLVPQLPHFKNLTFWPTSLPIFRSTLNKCSTKHESFPQCLFDAIAKDLSLYPELLCEIFHPMANQVLDIIQPPLMAMKKNLLRDIHSYRFEKLFTDQQKGAASIIKCLEVIQQARAGTGRTALITYAAYGKSYRPSELCKHVHAGVVKVGFSLQASVKNAISRVCLSLRNVQLRVSDDSVKNMLKIMSKKSQQISKKLAVNPQSSTPPLIAEKEHRVRNIFAYGFENPSTIQQRRIVSLTKDPDVIQQAHEKTGRIAIFASDLRQQLDGVMVESQAWVRTPTRELVQQSEKLMRALGDFLGVKVPAGVGGASVRENRRILLTGFHVVVGTPGHIFCEEKKAWFGFHHVYKVAKEELLLLVALEVLIFWRGRPPEVAAWRSFASLRKPSPNRHLEDKVVLKSWGIDTTLQVVWE